MSSQPSRSSMGWCEDEIDLRKWALVLWGGRWIVVGTVIVVSVIAGIISLVLPRQYQTEADVVLTAPKLQVDVPGDLALQVSAPDLNTIVAMVQAPDIFQALVEDEDIQALWPQDEEPLTWQTLVDYTEVKTGGEDGLRLLVKDTNPERAALVANRWAKLVAERVNEQYGWKALHSQIDAQTQLAWDDYRKAEEDYLQAVGEDQSVALKAQLARAENDLECVLSLNSTFVRLREDVVSFERYLNGVNQETALSPGDALALASLQQRVLAAKTCVPDTASVQVQWSSDVLTALTVDRANVLLQELDTVVQQRVNVLPVQQQTLETKIRQLSQSLENEQRRLSEAKEQRDAAWNVYQSLDALHSRGSVLAMPENQVALVASQAVVPEDAVSPRPLLNLAVAAILGGFLAAVGVMLSAWWRDEGVAETS